MENNDLISRSELLKNTIRIAGTLDGKYPFEAISVVAIENAPAVKYEPIVYAKWEHIGGDEWCCSNCCEITTTEGSWEKPVYKRCYECGAHMNRKEQTNGIE